MALVMLFYSDAQSYVSYVGFYTYAVDTSLTESSCFIYAGV